tara:strand:+ start:799 stop:987 length:189 start_codon:yes stop_codon:yes gene_type:complete
MLNAKVVVTHLTMLPVAKMILHQVKDIWANGVVVKILGVMGQVVLFVVVYVVKHGPTMRNVA